MVEPKETTNHIQINYPEFSDKLAIFLEKYTKVICIFKGSIDKATQQGWCPDCVAAEPLISEYLIPMAKEKEIAVIQCSVGEKEEWKSPKHPLRINPKVHLKCIPSILEINKVQNQLNIKVKKVGIQKKIEEADCLEKSLLELLFK